MLTTTSGKNILIDTTPDLRTQLLRAKINCVDAVIVTHDHADHTHGLDDLRPLCRLNNMNIPVHCSPATAEGLRKKFDYIFDRDRLFPPERPVLGGGIPMLDLVEFHDGQHWVAGEEFEFFSLPHGHFQTTAFRLAGLAYLVDCHEVPQDILRRLRDKQLDYLVLDCVQPGPHQTHLGWDKAREILDFIRPKKAGLIHMNHDWDHEVFCQFLQAQGFDWAVPLIDGEVLHFPQR